MTDMTIYQASVHADYLRIRTLEFHNARDFETNHQLDYTGCSESAMRDVHKHFAKIASLLGYDVTRRGEDASPIAAATKRFVEACDVYDDDKPETLREYANARTECKEALAKMVDGK